MFVFLAHQHPPLCGRGGNKTLQSNTVNASIKDKENGDQTLPSFSPPTALIPIMILSSLHCTGSGIYITGSQPLPSPSSSFGESPSSGALDRWAFGMSRISDEDKDASINVCQFSMVCHRSLPQQR
jgi:serine/threonine-protein kinase SRPK3